MRALIALLLLLATVPAAAQAGNCRIDVRGIEFGTYSSLTPAPETATGAVRVICTPRPGGPLLPRVTIGPGNSGNFLDRTLVSGIHELRYNLYAEPSRRLVLGDGSMGTTIFPAPRTRAVGTGVWPVFGAIAPGQRVPAGIYTDTLLIIVEF